MKQIAVREIMVTSVVTVGVDEAFSHVAEKMRIYGIRHLPVVDENKKVVGMVTQRDLLRTLSPKKTEDGYIYDKEQLDRFILKYVMANDPVCVGPDDSMVRVVDIMARDKYGCVPVVTPDKTLLGIVTQIDILKCLSKWLQEN